MAVWCAILALASVVVGSVQVSSSRVEASVAPAQCPSLPVPEHPTCRESPSTGKSGFDYHDRRLKKADPSTIQDKFLVGYQGWFMCAGDGPPIHPGHHGWQHWFTAPLNNTSNARPNMDMWPDTSAYPDEELYDVPGLRHRDNSSVGLFSSRDPSTVRRHFRWMAESGVDGAFLQRFATQLEVDGQTSGNQWELMQVRDEVLDDVRAAAATEDRVFAMMYDLSNLEPHRLNHTVSVDWGYLIDEKNILSSPNYLHEDGRPVVGIWGVGFADKGFDPRAVIELVQQLRKMTPGGVYLMAGTPTHWASLSGDQDPDERWLDVYYDYFDAISPWTVGRYDDLDSADAYASVKLVDDLKNIQLNTPGRNTNYIPVVFPGMSAWYLTDEYGPFNWTPRLGGRFLWRQIYHARKLGIRTIYGAMWDEYDEGTAFLPVVSSQQQVPTGSGTRFMALDVDGYDLPSDWYMRIAGLASELLRSGVEIPEEFPQQALEEYWNHRPFYEDYEISLPTAKDEHRDDSRVITSHINTNNSGDEVHANKTTNQPQPAASAKPLLPSLPIDSQAPSRTTQPPTGEDQPSTTPPKMTKMARPQQRRPPLFPHSESQRGNRHSPLGPQRRTNEGIAFYVRPTHSASYP